MMYSLLIHQPSFINPHRSTLIHHEPSLIKKPHSSALHSSLLTPHSPLLTAHCSLPTPHSPLITAHSPLPTHHSSLPTPLSSLLALRSTTLAPRLTRQATVIESYAAINFKLGNESNWRQWPPRSPYPLPILALSPPYPRPIPQALKTKVFPLESTAHLARIHRIHRICKRLPISTPTMGVTPVYLQYLPPLTRLMPPIPIQTHGSGSEQEGDDTG